MALKGAKGSVRIIDKATRPLQSIANAFKKMGDSARKNNKHLTKTQKAINGISKVQNRLNRVNANLQRQTRGIGSQAMGVAALALSFKAALNPAIKFEQAMKNLEAVAFGAADATVPVAKNMALLSGQAKKLGASTAFSASQAAEGQIFLAKAGFKTNQILATMPSLLDLASASGAELGRTSDVLSDLLGAFGMKAGESGRLADVLAAATSSANVDMETLFETLKVAAPIGVAAGQSMEGMVAATAILGNVGIKGSMAGTALKNSLVNLASPAAKGAKMLKSLGIDVADSAGNMLPMEKILLNLGKSAKKLSQTKRIEAFSAVFGKIAMAGALNLEKAVTSGDFQKMVTNLENADGVARKMAKIRMDSTEGSIVQLMSAVEGLAISFGSILTPILRRVAEAMIAITSPISDLIKNNKEVVKWIGYFAGALLAAKIAILAYTATLWLLTPVLTAFSVALKIAKVGLIAFNLVMSLNPIALVVAGLVSLVAGMVWAYNEFEEFRKVLDIFSTTVISGFKNIGEHLKAAFAHPFDYVRGRVAEFLEFIQPVIDKIKSLSEFSIFGDGKKGSPGFFDSISNMFTDDESTIAPKAATQKIQQNVVSNHKSAITVNVTDGRVRSIETTGRESADVFLNNGEQN